MAFQGKLRAVQLPMAISAPLPVPGLRSLPSPAPAAKREHWQRARGCRDAAALGLSVACYAARRKPLRSAQALPESSEVERSEDRFAQIQAAMRRGEERARAEGEEGEEAPARRMTLEEEKILESFFVQAGDMDLLAEDVPAAPSVPGAGDLDAAEERIRKTLEFCPDGKLAWEILQEMTDSGQHCGVGAYDAVMEAFSRRGALDDALAVFKGMQEAQLQPTEASYNLLAKPASKSGEYRFVEMLFAAKARESPDADIGAESLTILLDAYANGLPKQAMKAQTAFRGAMASAESAKRELPDAAPGHVLKALKRAVGPETFKSLQEEYGLDAELPL
mmetsp:Transcript_89638/g.159185  ORF Transcript_89638/g.159185 Transcript_89638/m.159185 type:complete len:335 (+) Transcript_89638:29-1033(+)